MTTIGKKLSSQRSTTPAPAQGSNELLVDVTVFQANNLPDLKDVLGGERHFYVVITDGSQTKKSKSVHSPDRSVVWNETLDGFDAGSSNIKLSLYARRHIRKDKLIGSLDIKAESKMEAIFPIASNIAPGLTVVLTVNTRGLIQGTKSALVGAEEALAGMRVLEEWNGTIENVRWVMDVVGDVAQIHPYAQMAWSALSSVPKLLLAQLEHDENIRGLVEAMHSAFNLSQAEDLLKAIKPNSDQALVLKAMLRHMKICSEVIIRYAEDQEFMKRLMRNLTSGKARDIQTLCDTLGKLRQELLDNATISTQIVVNRIQVSMELLPKQISDMDIDAKMNDLPYKSGWRSISGVEKNGCLPGTRTDFLDYIIKWVGDPASTAGLALFGQAGTGKSTIAHEIALRFQLEDRLGSYNSFSRNDKSKREDHHLFTTIIHDLSNRYPAFKTAVGNLIKDNKPLRETNNFNQLFNTLILGPLMELDIDTPILIIIDALDESANAIEENGLPAFLSKSLGRLPSNVRVLLTSRLDGDIKNWFACAENTPFQILEMNNFILARTEDDIRFYFQDSRNLAQDLFQEYGDALIQKSEGLFQWAAVACDNIKKPPPGWTKRDCLRGLLNRNGSDWEYAHQLNRPLYELYDNVLSGYFNTDIARRRFRSVMGQLLAAAEPLSVNSLTALRHFVPSTEEYDEDTVISIVKHLGSVLSNVTSNDHNLPIAPLHTSFRDFLTENVVKDDFFFVDLSRSHFDLTHACLDLMQRELKFNICELETSYLPNRKVLDLYARIKTHIQPALFYACRSWDDHLEKLSFDKVIFDQVREFFEEKFLFWLEVLSVTDTVPLAVQAFATLKVWMKLGQHDEAFEGAWTTLNDLVVDAYRFLRYFAMPIAESAPHLYISALPFTPISSRVYQLYSRLLCNTVAFTPGQQVDWPALEMSINTNFSVNSVAFSPDNQYIATALKDCTVCIWNSTTGRMEGQPLAGHSDEVNSVAFSPDGKRVVSGSSDMTVCVWNVTTGELVQGPLTGHNDVVNSVQFSPDGKWIASGSDDHTIRLWDASTGQLKQFPYTGHTDEVWSVSFSPDGTMVASGSKDKEIRIWNTFTGQEAREPFGGHTDWVTSVAFSPDGQTIVSGSFDKTILLWTVATGAIIQRPITGHNYSVHSVAFSPDGSHIVSGCADGIIYLWGVNTGLPVQRLDGQTANVVSVAFSPDGQRIVSGSIDWTFCLWNVSRKEVSGVAIENENLSLEIPGDTTFTGHSASVMSVAFSPNGTCIVSGSIDSTICLWNTSTGQLVIGPINEDIIIYSVAFSPDGKWIASGAEDGAIRLRDASTGKLKRGPPIDQTYEPTSGLPFSGHTHTVYALAFSPDGQRIASASDDKTIRVWSTLTGQLEGDPFIGHTDTVWSVGFLPNGKRIVSGSSDHTVCLWNVTTGELEQGPLIAHTNRVYSVATSPNGMWIVSGSQDETLCLWNALTGKLEQGPLTGHTNSVTTVAFSADGNWIVSGSADLTIRVWNASSGELEYTLLSGHTDHIMSVSFSPDGKQIVSGGWDSTVRVMATQPIPVTQSTEICFNDHSVVDSDGWIRGDDGELLLWIPSLHRTGLYRPTFPIHIIGRNQTRLDTSKFVHGSSWAACYTPH